MANEIYDGWLKQVNELSDNFYFEERRNNSRNYVILLTTKIPFEQQVVYSRKSNSESVRSFLRDTYRLLSMYYFTLNPQEAEKVKFI